MSREVMGSASDGAVTTETTPDLGWSERSGGRADLDRSRPRADGSSGAAGSPQFEDAVHDELAVGLGPAVPASPAGPGVVRARRLLMGAGERVDLIRTSRVRTIAAVGVAGLVAGLVGAGATARLLDVGADQGSTVVAWLDYSDGSDFPGNERVITRLNVVNAGTQEVIVSAVDFAAGLEGGATNVSGRLVESMTVAPGAHAQQEVVAEVDDCAQGPVPQGVSRDGALRVQVTGADLRSSWVQGASVGAFSISASTIIDMACGQVSSSPVRVEETSVRADGTLSLTLRSSSEDPVVVDVRGPDGVRFVGEPALPVTVPRGQRDTVTLGVELVVDSCTAEAQQFDAGNLVRLVVGEEEIYDYDFLIMNSWVVRQVTRACG